MSETSGEPGAASAAEARPLRGRRALLEKHRWLVFVLPLAVYLAAGSLEPKRPKRRLVLPPTNKRTFDESAGPHDAGAKDAAPEAKPQAAGPAEESGGWLPASYRYYPLMYTIKIALTLAAIWFVLPGYGAFPVRVTLLAVLVGAAGIIVWIGLCELHLEQKWLEPLGLKSLLGLGERPAFDPFRALAGRPWQLWSFVAVRLFGLVAVVALIEEFFLRGFLMRFVMDVDWWQIPIGRVNLAAVVACVVYAVLSHPAELFAAVAWFLLITLLAVKTKSIWDCVVAHATTNLLLGVYVLALGQWHYW
jgi:CAAX prenyl protease-like protein